MFLVLRNADGGGGILILFSMNLPQFQHKATYSSQHNEQV